MRLLDIILKWAEEEQLEIKQEEEGILFPVNGENGNWYARVSALEDEDIVFIVTAYPFHVSEEAREKTAVALGKITSQLKMGAFYIDVEDGQINFRLSQKVSVNEQKEVWVRELIMLAMKVTDTYFRKMMGFAVEA